MPDVMQVFSSAMPGVTREFSPSTRCGNRIPLVILLVLAFPLAGAHGAAEEGDVEFSPIGLAAAPQGALFVCGNSYAEETGEQGYWFWKVDAQGERVWAKRFPSRQEDELVMLVPSKAGGCTALGQRFVKGSGYAPFLQTMDADGNPGTVTELDAQGMVRALLQLGDGSFLIGGAAENSKGDVAAKQEGKADETALDAWLLKVSASGTIVWQKWLDHGSDEMICALAEVPDGGFYGLAQSGKMDKFGSGRCEVWLFKCNGEGAIEHEATVPDGRFAVSGGDGLLVQHGDGLALVCSLPQSAISKDVKRDPFSFPARTAGFSSSLEPQWAVDFLENHSISTPALAVAPGEGYLLAGAGSKFPVLNQLSPEGVVQKSMKGSKWSFRPMMNLEGLLVDGSTAYFLGSVCDFMSDDDDIEHVFLTQFDLSTGKALWQQTY